LGTSKIANPYRYAVKTDKGALAFKDLSRTVIENAEKLDIACLVCIGGDGTLGIAHRLYKDGIPVVGVPKTIDNDIRGTEVTFGFDTAVSIATEAIDRLHTTAQSHHRVMVIEVMGHHAGWIALCSGIAGGGDIILIPEIPYSLGAIAQRVKESADPVRLGGVGFVLGDKIEKMTGIETRTVVMGHLLRGGSPTAFDRVLATQLGTKAAEMIAKKEFGRMVGVKNNVLVEVALHEVAGGQRTVPPHHYLIKAARSVGTCFGD